MNKEELKNEITSIIERFNNKDASLMEELKWYSKSLPTNLGVKIDANTNDDYSELHINIVRDEKYSPNTLCMSDEEFKRISEAATDALTDMELKGYDIECYLRGVENVHLRNSKIEYYNLNNSKVNNKK